MTTRYVPCYRNKNSVVLVLTEGGAWSDATRVNISKVVHYTKLRTAFKRALAKDPDAELLIAKFTETDSEFKLSLYNVNER